MIADALTGQSVQADAVFGQDGFLVGLESTFDAQNQKLKSFSGAVGYSAPEYSVMFKALGSLSAYQAGYYHRVNRDTEAGAIATYSTKNAGNVALEVGAKTYLDAAAFVSEF